MDLGEPTGRKATLCEVLEQGRDDGEALDHRTAQHVEGADVRSHAGHAFHIPRHAVRLQCGQLQLQRLIKVSGDAQNVR